MSFVQQEHTIKAMNSIERFGARGMLNTSLLD